MVQACPMIPLTRPMTPLMRPTTSQFTPQAPGDSQLVISPFVHRPVTPVTSRYASSGLSKDVFASVLKMLHGLHCFSLATNNSQDEQYFCSSENTNTQIYQSNMCNIKFCVYYL